MIRLTQSRIKKEEINIVTSNVLDREVGNEVLVQRDVLLLGQDGVVEGNLVLLEELSGDITGDIEKGVAHAEDGTFKLKIRTHIGY